MLRGAPFFVISPTKKTLSLLYCGGVLDGFSRVFWLQMILGVWLMDALPKQTQRNILTSAVYDSECVLTDALT